jgi:hypothetical protein
MKKMINHPPLLVIDCETLGLGDAPIWEIGALRINEGGTIGNSDTVHLFVEHDPEGWLEDLPKPFRDDYQERFVDKRPLTVTQKDAVRAISYAARGRVLVLGSNPGFDMQRIEKMAYDNGIDPPPWHYHPEDVPTLARGWLNGKGIYPAPPWKSDLISQMIGIDPRNYDRHTALGDCTWTLDMWRKVMEQ